MKTLFRDFNKVDLSIKRLKAFEPPEGYFLAFSGGKDSIVLYHLAEIARVKFDAHFNITTVDPPELIHFIKKNYPSVVIEKPAYSMRQLIIKKKSPPTRIRRFCCEFLKERGGKNRFVLTGIRAEESLKRKMVEFCAPQRKKMLHPIIDWEEWEVWKFIEGAGLRYCRLYDEGFKRIGCVGCPLAGVRMMKYEFRRWPHFEKMYRKAFEKMIEERKKAGLPEYWKTSEDCMKWWLKEKKIKSPKYIEQKLLLEVPEWP